MLDNLFNNRQRTGYEEISTYYPIFYKDILEMDTILMVGGNMLEGMASSMEIAASNRFVESMDAESVRRMELFYSIPSNKGKSMEERKNSIMAALIGNGKISGSKIEKIVQSYIDTKVRVEFAQKLIVKIDITNHSTSSSIDIKHILKKKIPAHIDFALCGQIGYWFTVQNKVILSRMTNRMSFAWYPRRFFNGTMHFDGSHRFNKTLSLNTFRLKLGYLLPHAGAFLIGVNVRFESKLEGHNGQIIRLHWSNKIVGKVNISTKNNIQAVLNERCSISVTIKHHIWFIDGEMCLDGSRPIDAYIIKEDL